jgi:hypothetical protein
MSGHCCLFGSWYNAANFASTGGWCFCGCDRDFSFILVNLAQRLIVKALRKAEDCTERSLIFGLTVIAAA